MANNPQYYLVQASALPEIFLKVAEAKRLLSTGEASTVAEAAHMTGISRSAFYKYRDAILPFQSLRSGRVITFQMMVHDEPGALAGILTLYADCGTNLLTINSIIPTNGCALVTVTAEVSNMTITLEELLDRLRRAPGVIKTDILAG